MKIINPWTGHEWTVSQILQCVGDGWAVILDDLIKDLEKLGWDGELYQVKEKFGGLRFYIGAGSDEVNSRIAQAEDESFKTCEDCGSPGTTSSWGGYWIRTLCDQHGDKLKEENEGGRGK